MASHRARKPEERGGELHWVQIEIGEERLSLAMARE